jgi:uncharacterized damage-inducible protein DinB
MKFAPDGADFSILCELRALCAYTCRENAGVPMLSPTYCHTFARYNAWMNDKLYAAAATLADEQRKRALGAFFGSLHGTLNHLMVGDLGWMSRFAPQAIFPIDIGALRSLDQILFDDFEAMRAARVALDQITSDWAQSVNAETLNGTLTYRRISGQKVSAPYAIAAMHFFNHQTHHRGQASTLLTQLGADIGVTDLIMMPGFLTFN